MAVLITLAIDCADNKSAAVAISERFSGHEIELEIDGQTELISCSTKITGDHLGWHVVWVEQEIYIGGSRSDLLNNANLRRVRSNLYSVLAGNNSTLPPATGFRAALFGEEAQDHLGDEDWLSELGQLLLSTELHPYYKGLILDQSLVRNSKLRRHLSAFIPGYLWWDSFTERNY